MIAIRAAKIALVAAILVATFVASYVWIAIVIVAWSLIAMDRWPNVLARRSVEPEMAAPTSLPA